MTGLYLPGNGLLHRWHPLTKLALLLGSLLSGFSGLWPIHTVPLLPWLWAALLLLLALADGTATLRRLLLLTVLTLGPLALSMVIVHGFFNPNGETILWAWGPLTLRLEGLRFGAQLLTRLVPLMLATALVLLTTTPADLAAALTEAGLPREIGYILLSALLLLPQMRVQAQRIQAAQQSRGLAVQGSVWRRIRAVPALLGPLLGSALLAAEGRALTLELRGFRTEGPRPTHWHALHDSAGQRLLRWVVLLTAAVLFVWGRILP